MTPPRPALAARLSVLAIGALAASALISTPAQAVAALGACNVSVSGTTITLTSDCTTSTTLDVADGSTVDGNGFTIAAVDPSGGAFTGAVLKSATGTPGTPASLNVKNLRIVANLAPSAATASLSGIYLENAGGSISNVSISGITINSGSSVGRAVEVRNAAATTAPNLAIDGLRVRNYNKSGVIIYGKTTYTATNMDIGPATQIDGSQWVLGASNSFTVVGNATGGPSGSVTNSTIAGNRYAGDDAHTGSAPESVAGALLVLDAPSLVVSGVTVTGVDSDSALFVANDQTGYASTVRITCSTLTRTAGGNADPLYGQAITNDGGAGVVNLTAGSNTFSGWAATTSGTVTATTDPACTPVVPPATPVAAKVTIRTDKNRVRAGRSFTVSGTATPALAGVKVTLQKKTGNDFRPVGSTTLASDGSFSITKKLGRGANDKKKVYRVVVGTGTQYAGGTSNTVKIRTR